MAIPGCINVSPYGNYVVTKKLTGAQIKNMLEASLTIQKNCIAANDSGEWDAWPNDSGSYLQVGGITVSFDGNFRSTLWSWEEAREFCTACLPYVDVLMGIEPYHLWKDENNYSAGDVKDDIPFQPDLEQQEVVFNAFVKRYPNLKCIARHVRYSPSCSENSLKAYLWYEGKTYESRKLTFNILDRVGGGDAFVSGVIYALMQKFTPEDTVNFGVASSAIKHTLHGDGNITDDVSLIRHVMQMNFDIKR